jgi:hypothetical protein
MCCLTKGRWDLPGWSRNLVLSFASVRLPALIIVIIATAS